MPVSLTNVFKEGGFKGPVLHSTAAADTKLFEESVRGKRILLVGGAYSAEDIALQAIRKLKDDFYIAPQVSIVDAGDRFTSFSLRLSRFIDK